MIDHTQEFTNEEYAQRVAHSLQEILIRNNPRIGRGDKQIQVQEVTLEQEKQDYIVTILFHEIKRPQCLFGFRVLAVNPVDPSPPVSYGSWVEQEGWLSWVAIIKANLKEHIEAVNHGLPDECTPGDVTWIGEKQTR